MTQIGMDVDVVRRTAAAIDSRADDLGHVVAAVDGLIEHIHQTWTGDAAREFHENWHGHDRGALTELVGQLHNYARTARSNADAQDKASGVGGSVGADGGSSDNGWGKLLDVGTTGLTLATWVPKDVGRYPKAWANVLARSTTAWDAATKHLPAGLAARLDGIPDDVLRYKRFGIVHDLNNLHGFLDTADKASGFLSGIQDGLKISGDLQSHHWLTGGLDSGTLLADQLKGSKAGYLYGVTVQSWVQAGKAAQGVDWSPQGMSELMSASPRDWADGFGGALTQMPDQLWNIFKL